MELLVDTHVFLWWQTDPSRLGDHPKALISSPSNAIFISAASIWEIAIKRRLGKLAFGGSAASAIGANGFLELPISASDAEAAGELVWDHGDPFDRLIVAQASAHGLTLITADAAIRSYGGVAQIAAG